MRSYVTGQIFERLQRELQSIYLSENPIHPLGVLMWLTGYHWGRKKAKKNASSVLLCGGIHSVSFFPQVLGNLVLSGSADGMILFWNLETGECEAAIQGHEGPVHSIDYNDDQHFFSSGG